LDRDAFSTRLKALRTGKNLSQEELGRLVGLKKAAVSLVESSQRAVSIDVLIALADAFDVSLDYLTGRSDDPARR
jgi:transcriptional regulator with XRE-family HTH domain